MKDNYLPGSVWSYLDATAVFFGGLVGSVLAVSFAIGAVGDDLGDIGQLISAGMGQGLAMIAIVAYLSRFRGTASWDVDFGVHFKPSDLLGLIYGMLLQIAVVLLVLEPLRIILQIEDPPQQSAVETASESSSIAVKVSLAFIFVVLAPLTEEILHRGMILSRARRAMSPMRALLLSSAVFAGIHLVDPDAIFAVLGLFVVGMVLGYQALRTGRIGLSIMTHAGFNLVTTLVFIFDLTA